METIQYSLNNISIDLTSILEEKKSKQYINLYISISEIYGNHTCILFETTKNNFIARFLDTNIKKDVHKDKFYSVIPALLQKFYTIIIIENIEKTNKKEIVAIHSPPNTNKTMNIITPNIDIN